jgi:adenylosuccinate lyase
MLGVEAGGDRQLLHEVIRKNSVQAREAQSRGEPNRLLERLAADHTFAKIPTTTLQGELDPSRYIGRAREQIGEFLDEYLAPLLGRAAKLAAVAEREEVTV